MDEIWLLLGMDINGHVVSIEAFRSQPLPYKKASDDSIVAYSVVSTKIQD